MATKQVLVIDDEADVREVAQASLELLAGLDVIGAGSGQEGLLKAAAEQPDLILLDVMLPEMDGLAVFQQLQSNPATQQIPVILLTAKVQPADQRRFAEAGIVAIITKPFKPADLAAQVLKSLGLA